VSDLGVLMTRHSTLISYLETVFRAITGRIGVKGGNIFPPVSGVKDRGKPGPRDREAKAWRTAATDFPMIAGVYPPNVMPEEILSEHPDRLRAVLVTGSNPLRSFADTTAYEQAFRKLDLLVTMEISMTETAALSHYVLPARSAYESWDGGIRFEFPKTFLHFRGPVVQPEGEQLETGEIFTRLADRLGLIPAIPANVYEAADSGNRLQFGAALQEYVGSNPAAGQHMTLLLAKTLGRSLGSVNQASLWGRLQNQSPTAQKAAARVGFTPGSTLGEDLFRAALSNPQGLVIGEVDPETWDHFQALSTQDGKIHLDVPEMKEWLKEIDPAVEAKKLDEGKEKFPLILSSGRHWDVNANSQMRNPEWNRGRERVCTLTMHPDDAKRHGLADGQIVRVITEAGEELIELEVTETTRPGYVVMPHGFGLVYQGKSFGANANRLSKNTHRDRLAATPLHRYIRCRVEAGG
jgi:anaerobic selenocysteine-containing dehydrogenase